jgi:hypothetical protein
MLVKELAYSLPLGATLVLFSWPSCWEGHRAVHQHVAYPYSSTQTTQPLILYMRWRFMLETWAFQLFCLFIIETTLAGLLASLLLASFVVQLIWKWLGQLLLAICCTSKLHWAVHSSHCMPLDWPAALRLLRAQGHMHHIDTLHMYSSRTLSAVPQVLRARAAG